MRAHIHIENKGPGAMRLAAEAEGRIFDNAVLTEFVGPFKPEAATLSSTLDRRAYWDRYGVDWRSVIKLHVEICDRLRASSSWWSS